MKLLIIFVLFFGVLPIGAQEFLANDSNGRLVKLDLNGCVTQSLGNIGSFTDIAAHPDGFIYAIKSAGDLHRVNLQAATVTKVAQFQGSAYYGLTASSNGLIYAATGGGTLKSYDPASDEIQDYPNMGYGASGDLTFYKGQMYMSSFTNELVSIHPDNPSLNKALIDFSSENVVIFGIISTLFECEIRTFAISGDNNARVFEIGWEDGSFNELCTVEARIYGGSSEFEFVGSKDVLYIDSYSKSNDLCEIANVSIKLNGDGIGDSIFYSLDDVNFQQEPIFSGLDFGKHYIYLRNELGCEGTDSIVLEPGNLNINLIGRKPASCGENNGEVSFEIETNADSFYLNNLAMATKSENLIDGEHSFYLSDTDGCKDSIMVNIGRILPPKITNVMVTPTTCGDNNGKIEIEISQNIYIIRINEIPLTNGVIEDLPVANYNLSVQDSAGCRMDTTIQLLASLDCNIYIPNIFSPNDDGFNDIFELYSPDNYEILASRIYDRWGSMVYSSQNGKPEWDGRFKTNYVDPGIYTYFISIQGKSKKLEFVGEVQVVK